MSETETKKKETGNIFFVIAAGMLLFLFSVLTSADHDVRVYPVAGLIGLVFLYFGLMHYSRYGKKIIVLKVLTILAAMMMVSIFVMRMIGKEVVILNYMLQLYQYAYLYLYASLVEAIAANYGSEIEISIHVTKTLCITTAVLAQITPPLVAGFSRISSMILAVIMIILFWITVLRMIMHILLMKVVVKKGTETLTTV